MVIIYSIVTITYFLFSLFLLRSKRIRIQEIKYQLMLFFILLLSFIVRIYAFDRLPNIDLDEAMGGVNAWSLGNYGIDYFHLAKNPVYLYAWGSGMNILYPLIAAPFVKYMGLSIISYRLPLIIISTFSILLLAYSLYRVQFFNNVQRLLTLMIIFLSPITICASRWAVESNLFISLMVIVTSFFILFVTEYNQYAKSTYLILMTLTIGLAAYCYSNNWVFLFSFTVCLYLWLLLKKKLSLIQSLCSILVLAIECFPLVLFMYVNFFSHKEIRILGLTIPKLAASRSAFAIENGHIISSIINNFINSVRLLLSGYEGIPKISPQFWGAFYPLMLAFFLIGVINYLVNEKHLIDTFMFLMFLSALWNVFLILPNFLHFNSIMLPILYFEARGVYQSFANNHSLLIFSAIFLFCLVGASRSYITNHVNDGFNSTGNTAPAELETMIDSANRYKGRIVLASSRDIRGTNSLAYFILPIFYTRIDPYTFHKEASYVHPSEFMSYRKFGKWEIENVQTGKRLYKGQGVYIVQKGIDISKHPHKLLKKGTYYNMYFFDK